MYLGKRTSVSPSHCPAPSGPHLSAGTHWGEGIGPTHEHLPASDNQDAHVVLTLLLKQEGNRGTGAGTALGGFPSHHCTTHVWKHPRVPAPPCSEVRVASVDVPRPHTFLSSWLTAALPARMLRAERHLHRGPSSPRLGPRAGGLVPTACPCIPETRSLLPAPSQALGPPRPHTSVFPLLWQERRVSSLDAHSVACGKSTDITWL